MLNHEIVFYSREKIFVIMHMYVFGEHNFKTDIPATSDRIIGMFAVESPVKVSKEYILKKSDIKYEKEFLVETANVPKPTYWLEYNGTRYNIKEVVNVGTNLYSLICTVMNSEALR